MHKSSKFSLLLSLSMVGLIFLTACGGSPRGQDAAPVPEEVAPADTSTPEPPPTPTESPPEPEPPASDGEEAGDATSETEAPTESQPEELSDSAVITLSLTGGIAGFCDTLTVNPNGDYLLRSCEGDEFAGTLEEQFDLEALQRWHDDLADFQLVFEDNPGGPDNMVTELIFRGKGSEEADEALQQVIFDWANGLLIRTRPQAVEAPITPEPPEVGPDGLCPEIDRPAMLVGNFENPSGLMLIDPDSQVSCEIILHQPPFGRITTAAGNIYYPVFDPEAETITVWQLSSDGNQTPLEFTTVSMAQFGPFGFILADDGTKIAWARAVVEPESEPPLYRNDLWVANIDGSDQVTLLDQVENNEVRYVEPVRFSQDTDSLFYALQPDGIGGMIFNFSGRFDNLYRIPAAGGESQLLYDCASDENFLCIGDIAPDGTTLAYSQPAEGVVQVIGSDGSPISTLTPPAIDYVGPAVFGPTGNLAFISATLSEAEEDELPRPTPGFINIIEPPYSGEPRTLVSGDGVATVWEWLDENRLAFGDMDESGAIGTSIVTIEGQVIELSPNFPLAVLR